MRDGLLEPQPREERQYKHHHCAPGETKDRREVRLRRAGGRNLMFTAEAALRAEVGRTERTFNELELLLETTAGMRPPGLDDYELD